MASKRQPHGRPFGTPFDIFAILFRKCVFACSLACFGSFWLPVGVLFVPFWRTFDSFGFFFGFLGSCSRVPANCT